LVVTAVSASDLKDMDTGRFDGESDSYATIFLPAQCKRDTECTALRGSSACKAACLKTNVKKDQLYPNWGQSKALSPCVDLNAPLRVRVYDSDFARSNQILFNATLKDWGSRPSGSAHTLTQPGSSSSVLVKVQYECC
jgi:hypothetical protein